MTREDREFAKSRIEYLLKVDDFLVKHDREALDIAIQALSQEPCDDAVSRQAVDKYIVELLSGYLYDEERERLEKLNVYLWELPSVTQKSGAWVEIDDEPHEVWECDHCGFVIDGSGCIEPYEYRDTYKYCPNCGAEMVEPQKSEEV